MSPISVVCDDDQATAESTLKLYRKVKTVYGGGKRFTSISFSDDEYYYSLQAADMVSSLIRQEAGRQFFNEDYVYRPLYQRLIEDMKTTKEAAVRVGIYGKDTIGKLSASYEALAKEHPDFNLAPLVEKKKSK